MLHMCDLVEKPYQCCCLFVLIYVCVCVRRCVFSGIWLQRCPAAVQIWQLAERSSKAAHCCAWRTLFWLHTHSGTLMLPTKGTLSHLSIYPLWCEVFVDPTNLLFNTPSLPIFSIIHHPLCLITPIYCILLSLTQIISCYWSRIAVVYSWLKAWIRVFFVTVVV